MKNKSNAFDYINICVLGFAALMMVFPLYSVLVASVSGNIASTDILGRVIPHDFNLDAYKYVLTGTNLGNGFRNTITITLVGVPFNLALTLTLAYALSKKWLFGRKLIMNMVIFTMFFGGGLVPFYLLITRTLGLRDTLWAIILPYGVNTFNMVIMKNFFQSLPAEIEESAYLDGANDIVIFVRIILPISLPLVATFVLFFAVDRWNEWYNSMLFSTKAQVKTLQLVLREMVVDTESLNAEMDKLKQYQPMFSMAVKCAATVVTMAPIMMVYPFVQKYFTQGIMIGAIKS